MITVADGTQQPVRGIQVCPEFLALTRFVLFFLKVNEKNFPINKYALCDQFI